MRYNVAICGGTFDHFHSGHAAFLRGALQVSKQLLLGITNDAYVARHKPATNMQSYIKRRQSVEAFLQEESALERVTIEPIDSVQYPPQWQQLPIEAIIVTEDTLAGAQAINRQRSPLPPLEVVVLDLLKVEDKKISSSDIRAGRIDTTGKPYFPVAWQQHELILPSEKRQLFKAPLGKLYDNLADIPEQDISRLATVGDAVTHACNTSGRPPQLAIVDLNVQRKQAFDSIAELGFGKSAIVLQATNPPGHLHPTVTTAIKQALELVPSNRQIVLQVTGEEDLTVIPLVLLLPLDWTILYGQPNQGIARLTVTPESKLQAAQLLENFGFY